MSTISEEFKARLGDAFTDDPQICRVYDHDLGEMPGILLMLFRRRPFGVVLAKSADDVKATLELAAKHNLPVTPRGQASSGYGGTMPKKGGIVLDLCRMNRVLAIDKEAMTCDVEPGVVWCNLDEELAPHGLASAICPTSGLSSTVGGMFAMGGMGIGSTTYGDILSCCSEIDVVHPDGSLHTIKGADLAAYAFSQGTLGVITRLRIALRPLAEIVPIGVHISDRVQLALFLLASTSLGPYSLSFFSASYLAMQAKTAGPEHEGPIQDGYFVLLAFAGKCPREEVASIAKRYGGSIVEGHAAEHEWAARFYPMRIKRNGPALLCGEFISDAYSIASVLSDIERGLPNDNPGIEAFLGRGGVISCLVYIPDSAEDLLSLGRMGKAMIPLHAATKRGGCVYASGLWFCSQTPSILGPDRTAQLLAKKRELDPENRMNPGTCWGNGWGFLPFRLLSLGIWYGTWLISPIAAFLKARPRTLENKVED